MNKTPRVISDTVIWWPLALGAGIGAFFAWPSDPPLWMGLVSTISLLFAWLFNRRRERVRFVVLSFLLFCVGFAAATIYTDYRAAPRWEGGKKPVTITAQIENVTPVPAGVRLLLKDLYIDGYEGEMPVKIRLVCRTCNAENSPVGATIRVRAVLSPPAGAARLGGFDFRFMAYFQQIGAIGFTFGAPEIIAYDPKSHSDIFARGRQKLTEIINENITDKDTRALAIALLTGVSSGLPEGLRDAYQSSGLAHIYSVSGLHLGFVAGLLFFLFRGVFALLPVLTLRYPTKKIAAILALVAVIIFTLFAGDSVPTWRSLLMLSLALLAVMTDRFAFTLRVVALSACAILLVKPDMLFSISFQLSYAAVTVLVAWMEWVQRLQARHTGGFISRHGRIIRDVLMTSLLASIATLPFILHSFGRLSPYAVLANLAGVPWTGFVIMPLILLAYLAFMTGLTPYALMILAPALKVLNDWAYMVADWPMADMRVATVPTLIVIACGLSLYLACAHPRKWTLGLVLASYIALGWLAFKPAAMPTAYISQKGLLAVRVDNTLWLSAKNKDKFVRTQWLAEQGLSDKNAEILPLEGEVKGLGHCDRGSCVLGDVVYVRKALGIMCREGVTLIAPNLTLPPKACPIAHEIIDYRDLKKAGVYVRIGKDWQAVNGEKDRVWLK